MGSPFPLLKLNPITSPPSVAVAEIIISTALAEVVSIRGNGFFSEDLTTVYCPRSKNLGTETSIVIAPCTGVGVGVTVGVGVFVAVGVAVGGRGVGVRVGVFVGTGGSGGSGVFVGTGVGLAYTEMIIEFSGAKDPSVACTLKI